MFVPIITYAAAGWANKLNTQHKRKLLAAQRQVLICVTKAYNTISADALTVIAGSSPNNLVLAERIAIYNLNKYKNFKHGVLSFNLTTNTGSVDNKHSG